MIFNTAIPHAVDDLRSPLVTVVEKTEGGEVLVSAIRDALATRLPEINRALVDHVDGIQRDYMWDFVATNWETFGATTDRSGLALLLLRRLAMSLSNESVDKLAAALGDMVSEAVGDHVVEPMRYYVMPPLAGSPLAGDIFCGELNGNRGHWVLLTPSCDLANVKAEFVLLARCETLADQPEYQAWANKLPGPTGEDNKRLDALLKNNRMKGQTERVYFLPAAFVIPDLIVDLQQVVGIPNDELDGLDRVASLDSPFAEALVARFTHYFGRIGTPDLNVPRVKERLRNEAGHAGEGANE